jgi:RNA polymerase sigma-70 factor (ECF subfamily)
MDLVQEVFLGVYRNLHRFRGDSKFSSWIFRIAYNKAVDMNRYNNIMASRTYRNSEEELDILENIPGRSNLEGEKILSDYQANKKIVSMLAALPLKQRLIVELKMFQSLTFEDIAEIHDISVNTAKTRFYSAIKKLKDVSESEHVL